MMSIIKNVTLLDQLNINKRTIASMVLLSLIWGAAPMIMKTTLLGIDPAFYSLARFILATLLLKIVIGVFRNKKEILYRDKLTLMIMGALLITPYSFLFLIGIQYTSSLVAAMINSTVSVWTLLIIYIFARQSPSLQCIIGMAISIVALGIFIFGDPIKAISLYTENSLFGNIVILLSTFCFAYYTFLLKPFEKLGFNGLHIAYYTFLGATASMAFIFLAKEQKFPNLLDISMVNFLGIFYMASFAAVFSYILHNQNVNEIGPHKATIAFKFVPIISFFLSAFLEKETITIRHLLASLMLIFGSFLILKESYSKNY